MNTAPTPPAQSIIVDLGTRSYPIYIGPGLLDEAGRHIAPYLERPFTVIVTDKNVAALHLETLQAGLSKSGIRHKSIIIEPGEASKSFARLSRLCEDILNAGIERGDTIIAFGGGVIGDLAGFAAHIVRRGVEFIQIPTSLLSQVDSSVGGKTGINTPQGKNLVGAFHQPKTVLVDTGVLATLPARQFRSGYAEIVKYGLIDRPDFFEWCEANWQKLQNGDSRALVHAIETSCRAKAAIVAEDELEKGKRALLNLGHTFGHVLEAATGYSGRLYHGEGVAIGMVLAFEFSVASGLCTGQDLGRVRAHLEASGLPTSMKDIDGKLPDAGKLMQLMEQDKKISGGKLVLILANAIGGAFIASDIDREEVKSFLARMLDAS